MTIGDHVRLHIDPGHSQALDLPEGVGVIQDIAHDADRVSLLVRFDAMSVYLTPVLPDEVEVVSGAPCGTTGAPRR